MNIENENTLKKSLENGINLFCSAGFSVEAKNFEDRKLPCGDGLLLVLKERFNSISEYGDLIKACTFLQLTENEAFHSFITEYFKVKSFEDCYNELLKLPLKNIFTTNVDNLWFKIFSNAENRSLNNIANNGSVYGKNRHSGIIDYYALHGCVENPKAAYIFSKIDLATAFIDGANSWESLSKETETFPIIFWGWNFADPAPLQAMYKKKNNINNNQNKWFLLYDDNVKKEDEDILRALGFNIIKGSTKEFLEYIKKFNIENKKEKSDSYSFDIDDKKYCIPNKKDIVSVPIDIFFSEYSTRWSHIYSNSIVKTHHYRDVSNIIDSGRNCFVIGIRGCGKTTLMMQLLKDFDSKRKKHFLIEPTVFDVKEYLRVIGNNNVLLFVDGAFQDSNALSLLLQHKNIQLVAFERDFDYESQFHKIELYGLKIIDITEISKSDAQEILNSIPKFLLQKKIGTKLIEFDPTIPNLFAGNVKSINFKFFNKFYSEDKDAAEVFLLVCYVHSCGVPCSFDMVYSFLGDDKYSWEDMLDIVERSGNLIKTDASAFKVYDILQDYYSCRSRFFAEKILENLGNYNGDILGKVLKRFVGKVSISKICNYVKFKKRCIDADLIYKTFKNVSEGIEFYNLWLEKDGNEYVYQQEALYLSKNKKYQDAFLCIDMAKSISSYNPFAVQSTYAQIWFDSNYDKNDKKVLKKALELLEECCCNDKKTRGIHFIHYVIRVCKFFTKYGFSESKSIIDSALRYINIGLNPENFELSNYHKNLLKKYKDKFVKIKDGVDLN